MIEEKQIAPIQASRRIVVLDALRGFALLGIAMANYPEFSLWTFQTDETLANMPSATADSWTRWLLYLLVDGKFYTIFSVLFGIGFSIIMTNAMRKGANGMRIFYRRMSVLAVIGMLHLMLLWSGDILLLYALMGMLLPLFRRCTDKGLLRWAAFFLLLPIGIDVWRELSGLSLAALPYSAWWSWCDKFGITEENFGTWLRDAHSYREMLMFLVQGAFERMWEFADGNRYFKVLGLFLIGFYLGRKGIFAHAKNHVRSFRKTVFWGLITGFPLSFAYAYSAMHGHPWGTVAHTVLYTLSVYPMGFAYMAALTLLYLRTSEALTWRTLACPGRMALTCYLLQSVVGVLLFYGIGLGMGASVSLWLTEIIALLVFFFEIIACRLWLRSFLFGPTEWLWRMLTYGRRFAIRRQ